MPKLSALAGAAAAGISSGVVVPVFVLIGVVGGIAGLVLGIGRWKNRRGYVNRITDSHGSSRKNDSLTTVNVR